jgi:hypothetical protein
MSALPAEILALSDGEALAELNRLDSLSNPNTQDLNKIILLEKRLEIEVSPETLKKLQNIPQLPQTGPAPTPTEVIPIGIHSGAWRGGIIAMTGLLAWIFIRLGRK